MFVSTDCKSGKSERSDALLQTITFIIDQSMDYRLN